MNNCPNCARLERRLESWRLAFLADDRQEPTDADLARIDRLIAARCRKLAKGASNGQEMALCARCGLGWPVDCIRANVDGEKLCLNCYEHERWNGRP